MSVYSLLQDDSGVSAITNSVYIAQAPQDTTAPYIVIDYVFISPDNKLDGAPTIDNNRVGIDCYGVDQAQSISLYNAARAALELQTQVLSVNFYGEREPETDYYRTQFDVSQWADR
jgi:hypothetical protein